MYKYLYMIQPNPNHSKPPNYTLRHRKHSPVYQYYCTFCCQTRNLKLTKLCFD